MLPEEVGEVDEAAGEAAAEAVESEDAEGQRQYP